MKHEQRYAKRVENRSCFLYRYSNHSWSCHLKRTSLCHHLLLSYDQYRYVARHSLYKFPILLVSRSSARWLLIGVLITPYDGKALLRCNSAYMCMFATQEHRNLYIIPPMSLSGVNCICAATLRDVSFARHARALQERMRV